MDNKQNKINVLVTGLGTVSGLGFGIDKTWQRMKEPGSVIKQKTEWSVEGPAEEYFGTCCEFSVADEFPGVAGLSPFRYSQLALVACKLALEDAGLTSLAGTDTSRIGLIINSDLGANTAAENYAMRLYGKGPERVSPLEFTKSVANCVIGDVARQFSLTGASSFIIGENSLSYGFDLIRNGKADVVVCGGFDEVRDRTVWNYCRRKLTVPAKGSYDELISRCGAGFRNQMVFGEGSAFIVIESEEHAAARNAKVYAVVEGEYSSCDGQCNEVIWERNPEDLMFNMFRVLEEFLPGAEKLSFIMGASVLPWQAKEYEFPAINRINGDGSIKYTSVKSRTGETFSTGPLLSVAVAAKTLYHKAIPGTGWDIPGGFFSLAEQEMLRTSVPVGDNAYCLVNSIQVGGNTTSMLLKSYREN